MTSVFKHPALCRSVGGLLRRRSHPTHDDIGAKLWLTSLGGTMPIRSAPCNPTRRRLPSRATTLSNQPPACKGPVVWRG